MSPEPTKQTLFLFKIFKDLKLILKRAIVKISFKTTCKM